MALTDENSLVMPVTPMNNGGMGFGGFGGDLGWIIIFLLFGMFGGWGNGGFGGGFGGGFDGGLYPWMNNSQNINNGFRDQMLNDNITSIRDGVYGINNQLCSGFAGVTASVTGAQNALASQMYANQIADLERSYAAQTASTQGMTALQSQLAQCCCDNRAATADLKYTVATENCADRTAAYQNTRDIIDSQTRGTQAILDKLCQLELDGVKAQVDAKNDKIVDLQNQLNMATFRESQVAQNAYIAQGLNNEVDALYNRLSNCPVPTTPVYGRTPIFTCGNQGCGCGCGA